MFRGVVSWKAGWVRVGKDTPGVGSAPCTGLKVKVSVLAAAGEAQGGARGRGMGWSWGGGEVAGACASLTELGLQGSHHPCGCLADPEPKACD